MTHTIIVRPASDFEPHIDGIVNHTVQIADGVEIITESTDYLRRLGEALIERADLADGTLSPTLSTPTESVTESAELQHPGTWLPGDRLQDREGDEWVRDETGHWTYDAERSSEWIDTNIDRYIRDYDFFRITHLVPRGGESA